MPRRRLLPGLLLLLSAHVASAAWDSRARPVPESNLRAVHAVSPRIVWVAGSQGTCLRTTNAGRTWDRLTIAGAEQLDFRGVVAFDAQSAVLMSAGEAEKGRARIYRTEDGGRTWQQTYATEAAGVFLNGIAFWDAQHGIAFGDPVDGVWFLLRTADGGRSWSPLRPQGAPTLPSDEAAFAASNSALVVQGDRHVWIGSGGSGRGRVYRSVDRGQTWEGSATPLSAGPTSGVFGLCFWDADRGIAVGGDYRRDAERMDNVAVTSDGGRTWALAGPAEPAGLKEAVVRLAPAVWLAVGPTGTSVSRDEGRTWVLVDGTSLHAVSAVAGQAWAVGERGLIVRWR